MRNGGSGRRAFGGRRNKASLFCLFAFALCLASCSIPNLEKPECAGARDVVKRFYSFHFGNDMKPTVENIKIREKYLTPDLRKELLVDVTGMPPTKIDYFTATENFPKAFRVGACKDSSPEKVTMQVLLFWKDDKTSEQREVSVETVKQGENWLINKVASQ